MHWTAVLAVAVVSGCGAPARLTLEGAPIEVPVGERGLIQVSSVDERGRPLDRPVHFECGLSQVLSIDGNGHFVCISDGTATVVATSPGAAPLAVEVRCIEGELTAPAELTLMVNKEEPLGAVVVDRVTRRALSGVHVYASATPPFVVDQDRMTVETSVAATGTIRLEYRGQRKAVRVSADEVYDLTWNVARDWHGLQMGGMHLLSVELLCHDTMCPPRVEVAAGPCQGEVPVPGDFRCDSPGKGVAIRKVDGPDLETTGSVRVRVHARSTK